MEDKTNNKTVVTSPSVEFLLKQVYVAYKEKIKGLESEVHQLKSELHEQKNRPEECKQCKVLSEELKKCKENYLESLSDQKRRIELLEMQLSSIHQVPVSKSKLPFLSKTNRDFPCETDEPTSKKQKKYDKLEFLHPEKIAKQKCLFFTKAEKSEKENLESLNLQPLSSIIIPETLDENINNDADIMVIGIYGKQTNEAKNVKCATIATVSESIDIDMLEAVQSERDGAAGLSKGIVDVTLKQCNETRKSLDEYKETNSPSLLPPIALLFGKPEYNIERNKDVNNYGDEQENSRTTPPIKHVTEKNEGNKFQISSIANTAVIRDITSPSLICPPEKKPSSLNIQSDEHKTTTDLCSPISNFGERDFLCKSEDILEDMDETYFPLPLTSYYTTQQNSKCKNDHNEKNKNNSEVIELDGAPNEVLIIEEECTSENEHPSTEAEHHTNHLSIDVNNPTVECSFDRVPKKDTGIKYKFKEEPVRKKEERTKLLGHPCKQCEEYYNQLDIPESEKVKRITKCSRHRALHNPPSTPEHYWELDFPDTPECKARGYMNETQKIQLQSRRRRPLVLRKDK